MGKIDSSRFGSAAPKLTPDDIEDAAILTIANFEEMDVPDDKSNDPQAVRHSANLSFEETGEKVLWLNKGQIETLIEQLGDDTDKWIGMKIPVKATVATFRNQKFPKVVVMASEEWDAAFKEAGVRRTPVKPVAGAKKR